MTTKTTIRTLAIIAALTATPAYADFYDAAPLPSGKNWQEHIVASTDGITAITKYVPAEGHTVLIAVIGTSNDSLNPLGIAQGYRFDTRFDNNNYIGIQPMIQTAISLDAITFVPTVYSTIIAGRLTFDPRVQAQFTVQYKGNTTVDAVVVGATAGYQITENLRIGPDVQTNVFAAKESLSLGSILRYDPSCANKNHWMELQLGTDVKGNATSALQYRINF
ncbi:MAG: hypothetical protein WC254_07745 [Candidatus Woesearchaeota archaeon]|jgi:hypothetical protein